MKLYDCETAPSPRKVRLFLAQKNQAIETIQIELFKGEQFSDWYRQKNPSCTVPALELDEGIVLCESEAICRYLEEIYPDPPLFGRTSIERALVNEWLQKLDLEGYIPVANFVRNHSRMFKDRALPGPDPVPQIPELVDRESHRAAQFFLTLNHTLETHSPWLLGDYFSVVDIFAFVTIEFAQKCKLQPQGDLTLLETWLEKTRELLDIKN